MKYKIHGKIPKVEYDKMKAAQADAELAEVERIFKVDLHTKKKTQRVMGVEFTNEEYAKMTAEPEEVVYVVEEDVKYDKIEDAYIAEQLGLEIDDKGDLVVPKKAPKRRGVFF